MSRYLPYVIVSAMVVAALGLGWLIRQHPYVAIVLAAIAASVGTLAIMAAILRAGKR